MNKFFAVALVLVVMTACQKKETTQTDTSVPTDTMATAPLDTAATSMAEKTYTMNGKLVSRDAAKGMVTIDNEEVPGGVMAPMVMAYELRGATVDSLPPDGSKITSTLHEQGGKYWVTDVKPVP